MYRGQTVNRTNSPDGVEQLTNIETLQFSDKSVALSAFYEANKLGNTTNDTLSGTDGADALFGYGGNDSLSGGRGDDVLYGDIGNDSLDGGPGTDELHGGDGDDVLIDDTGTNKLYGDAGNDRITGSGNDAPYGGDGNDTVKGGISIDCCLGYDLATHSSTTTSVDRGAGNFFSL